MSDKSSKNKQKFKDINKQNKVNCLENDIKLDQKRQTDMQQEHYYAKALNCKEINSMFQML